MDKHVSGMCGVYCQLISNVYHRRSDHLPSTIHGPNKEVFNKSDLLDSLMNEYEIDHPLSKWAADSLGNYVVALIMTDTLHREYHHRFGKGNTTADIPVLCNKALRALGFKDSQTSFTPFPIKAQQGLDIPKGVSKIQYEGRDYFGLSDVNSVVRYNQHCYKQLVRDEMNRTGRRLSQLYKNRQPPQFLSSLEKIIIPKIDIILN